MRKAEFYIKAEKGFDKNGDKFLSIYKACQYRWENTADPERADEAFFFSQKEAEQYLNTISLNIGFELQIDLFEFDYEDFNLSFDFGFEGEIKDFIKDVRFEVETIFNGCTFQGEEITGSIIIRWSYEKYVGYCRNLLSIGVAGEYPFNEFENQNDLITGNEDSTFKSNYSILLTKKQVEESGDLEESINEALNSGAWKWNNFRNNPESRSITEMIKELI